VSLGLSYLWFWLFTGVLVGVFTGVLVGVLTGVFVGVFTGVLVGVLTGVLVGVFAGVLVGVLVGVLTGVLTGVLVGVLTGVLVGVLTGVLVGVLTGVLVGVGSCFLFGLFIFEGLNLLLHFLIDLVQGDCDILWILKLVRAQELRPFSLKANWLVFAQEASVSQVEIAGGVLGGVLNELACKSDSLRMNFRLRLRLRSWGLRSWGFWSRGFWSRGRGLLSVSESSLLS